MSVAAAATAIARAYLTSTWTAARSDRPDRVSSVPFSAVTTGGSREITSHVDHAGDGVCRNASLGPDSGADELVVSSWRRERPRTHRLGGPEDAGDAVQRSQQADLAHRRHSQVASGTGAVGRESGADA